MRPGIFREVSITEAWARAYQPFALKASEALFDIRGILRALLLSVIDDVQTNGDLLLHDLGHRGTDTGGKGGLVE